MRRLLATLLLLLLLLPDLAAAQHLAAAEQDGRVDQTMQTATAQNAWLVPMWRAPDGHLFAVVPDYRPMQRMALAPLRADDGLHKVVSLDGRGGVSTGMTVTAGSRLYSRLRLDSGTPSAVRAAGCDEAALRLSSCAGQRQNIWRGGTLAGGWQGDSVLVDFGVDWMRHDMDGNVLLLLPDAQPSALMGIPGQWIGSADRIHASSSLQLGDSDTRLDLGASVGRVHLLPEYARSLGFDGARLFSGAELGMDRIDQKSISLGLGKGAFSGSIVGRVMRPDGMDLVDQGVNQQWSALDLGVTWRLPWEGELSLGAQNLWSSNDKINAPRVERDAVQSRIPYIQYHQEL